MKRDTPFSINGFTRQEFCMADLNLKVSDVRPFIGCKDYDVSRDFIRGNGMGCSLRFGTH